MQEHSDHTMDFPSFIELKLAERVQLIVSRSDYWPATILLAS